MKTSNTIAQYAIWYANRIVEHTGYIATLRAAKKFARERFGNEVQISIVYPPSRVDNVRHEVRA
jgi:hypothetical protein